MKNIIKAALIATTLAAGAVHASALSESDYPFVPNVASIDAGQKVEQRMTKESSSPAVVVNSTKTRKAVQQELLEYQQTHGDVFISN
ncbi:MAG: hypothetical protein PHN76_13215 [Advenella sp.]|uniref:hypothetical protein n=1 Tax=Advenella sp. TaxID=1872388 RepID=UPI00258E7080|nr:hypothetical protein [Advenella sp.]MDD3759100.1 hypothetical protein [Advenella sp.]